MPSGEVSPRAVRSRSDLESYLGQSLLAEYYDTSGRRPRQVSTSLKTYLVEVHSSDPEELQADGSFTSVRVTDEDDLWLAFDRNEIAYFLDMSNGRFAFIHTIGLTNDTDATWKRFATSGLRTDYCWLPSKFLESVRLGYVIGFRLFGQQRMAGLDISEEAEELAKDLGRDAPPAFRFVINDWATAERDLETFRSVTEVGRRAAIDSINWRKRLADEGGEGRRFIHDEVWSTGKVTAYGTSWASHLANVRLLRDTYSNLVTGLEEEFSLRWTDGGLSGRPITVAFEGPHIEDLGRLAADICDGSEPFRLVGQVDDTVGDGMVAIDAVDLHTSGRVHIELTSEHLRIDLRQGTCGNVVTRFLVNFEHYMTSQLSTSIDERFVPAR